MWEGPPQNFDHDIFNIFPAVPKIACSFYLGYYYDMKKMALQQQLLAGRAVSGFCSKEHSVYLCDTRIGKAMTGYQTYGSLITLIK